jgi:ethanolamine utilization protein EutN
MQPALVLGTARATAKHVSLTGQKLLICQPLGPDDTADGPPQLVVDQLGADRGDHVMLTSDGKHAVQILKSKNTPVRWTTIGIIDSDS